MVAAFAYSGNIAIAQKPFRSGRIEQPEQCAKIIVASVAPGTAWRE